VPRRLWLGIVSLVAPTACCADRHGQSRCGRSVLKVRQSRKPGAVMACSWCPTEPVTGALITRVGKLELPSRERRSQPGSGAADRELVGGPREPEAVLRGRAHAMRYRSTYHREAEPDDPRRVSAADPRSRWRPSAPFPRSPRPAQAKAQASDRARDRAGQHPENANSLVRNDSRVRRGILGRREGFKLGGRAIGPDPFNINSLRKWVPNGPSEQPTEKVAPERRILRTWAQRRSQQLRPE
jgi:hypothetical protein